MNIILNTDSYKASHFLQYPPNTSHVSSYVEARKNNFGFDIEGVVHFGLQKFLLELESNPITFKDVLQAEEIFLAHGEPFYKEGWMSIVNEYNGQLPLYIESVEEGKVYPIGTPLVQVVNTVSGMGWLTSYIETALLRAVWYPSTVATLSREIKRSLKKYFIKSSDDLSSLNFKLHDFGARGVSSRESAGIGGLAHLVNFMGTDTVTSLIYARKYYFHNGVAGFSIPAAEHSTITSWGESYEAKAYENMLDQFTIPENNPSKLIAVVSDSYDLYNAVSNIWGRKDIVERIKNSGYTVVIRPDSGVPEQVVPKVLELLEEKFGSTLNSKGYKILPPYIRVIQGDGINYHSIDIIAQEVLKKGFSIENVAFGMGGALLQQVNRDTLAYAMKCNAVKFNNHPGWISVQKKPKTDPGKASKAGRINSKDFYDVFLNGYVKKRYSLSEVRKNAEID